MPRRLAVRLDWFGQAAKELLEGRLAPDGTGTDVFEALHDMRLRGVPIRRGDMFVGDGKGFVRSATSRRDIFELDVDDSFQGYSFDLIPEPDWSLRAVRAAVLMPAAEAASCTRFPHTLDAAQVVELGADAGDCECVYVLASPKMRFRELASTLGAVAETCAGGKPIAFYVDMICGPLLPGDDELEPLVPDPDVAALCSQIVCLPGTWACREYLYEREFLHEMLSVCQGGERLAAATASMAVFVGHRRVLHISTMLGDVACPTEGLALLFSMRSGVSLRHASPPSDSAPEILRMAEALPPVRGIERGLVLPSFCMAMTMSAEVYFDTHRAGLVTDSNRIAEFAKPLCVIAQAYAALHLHNDACRVLVRVLTAMRATTMVNDAFFYQLGSTIRLVRPGPFELFEPTDAASSDAFAEAWAGVVTATHVLVDQCLTFSDRFGLVAAQGCMQLVSATRDWPRVHRVAARVRALSRFAATQHERDDARVAAELVAAAAELLEHPERAQAVPGIDGARMRRVPSMNTFSCWCEAALLLVEALAVRRQCVGAVALAGVACKAMHPVVPARLDDFRVRACAAIVIPYETHRRQLDEAAHVPRELYLETHEALARTGRDTERLGVTVRRYWLHGLCERVKAGKMSVRELLAHCRCAALDAEEVLVEPRCSGEPALTMQTIAIVFLELNQLVVAREFAARAMKFHEAMGERGGPTAGATLALLGTTWLSEAPARAAALLQAALVLLTDTESVDRASARLRLADTCKLRGMHMRARALRMSVVRGFVAREGAASRVARLLRVLYDPRVKGSLAQRSRTFTSLIDEVNKACTRESTQQGIEDVRCVSCLLRGSIEASP